MRQEGTNRRNLAHPLAGDGGQPIALAVIGGGRAGGAIARAARDAGLYVRLARRGQIAGACDGATAALLCVPDGEIESACADVAAAGPPAFVGHVSGATPLSALAVAAERGAATFALHPLQTIPGPDADLTGSPCAIGGSSPPARAFAEALALRLGLQPFELDEPSRIAYHAAATMASNLLVALEESAADLLSRAGIEDGRELLAPLVLRTAANWAAGGAGALTGPIARGDEATVTAHLRELEERAPELVGVYRELAARAREIAASAREGAAVR
jgi:predicted short-subunit dehydrogenase-like oxidoreductase (DUF2520 family)